MIRVLLVEPNRAWRLEELGRAAEVSLGHSHNVIKRLEELAWVERDDSQRFRLSKPADLLEGWCESYTYRTNERTSYLAPERVTRKFMGEVARVAGAEGRRYAFTLNAGAALLAPSLRLPAVHCYLEETRAGRSHARAATGRGGRRSAPLVRALRPRRVLRRLREGRAQGGVLAAAVRRSRELRAPRTGAGRAPAARGDGLLNDRGRR